MPFAILLAADIFGHTPELQELARELTRGIGGRVRILSPYGDERPRFASEVEAFAAYTARSGLEPYALAVAQALAETRPALAVGFSAGAAALWLACARSPEPLAGRAVLYYGTRIRDNASLRPAGDVRLIFAEREKTFDPSALVATLRENGMAAELRPGTAHGFMNRLSPGFDAQAYAEEIARLRALL